MVKIAYLDPFSDPFAAVGQNILRHFQFAAEAVSDRQLAGPGIRFEIVPFDTKGSPQEALTLLRAVADQGIRYVAQGQGSHVAIPLSEAIARNNERNPGQSMVFLNYAAIHPDLTNGKCNFWHFAFDASVEMKMEALTDFMKGKPEIRNVYLLNQNYSFGQQVARFARDLLARKRPDVKVVGEDLVPLGQVRDFSPYIAKIRAAGADTVITGNWGTDLVLFVRAARDAGLVKNNPYEHAKQLCDAGLEILCLDIANGNHTFVKNALKSVESLKSQYGLSIIAGNVATPQAAIRLAEEGADAVKIGIGPGAVCTTRRVTGFGVPQLTAILDCVEALDIKGYKDVKIIADGGIRHSGDVAKGYLGRSRHCDGRIYFCWT